MMPHDHNPILNGSRYYFFDPKAVFFGAFLFVLSFSIAALAADPPITSNVISITNRELTAASLSTSFPSKLEPWQEKLTLGPGDVLNIGLYHQPETTVPDLFVGPDGRINYLDANDVMAADLTIDELRDQLEGILSKSYLAPKVIITPVAYKSKKYYMLGNVIQKGVFMLDKPTTIVEAIAKARGFVTIADNRTFRTQVNFGHSFLIRRGADGKFARIPVDFEQLFQNGALNQNQRLAPDDYLYFPALELQDVYVLGEVLIPGVALYSHPTTALQAISKRGGFTDNAFRRRLLVVRGSLTRPETFVVDASDILAAKAPDFELMPGDIVYVAKKPWAKAEELFDSALRGFVDAVVITWTGQNIGPLIK